MSRLLRRAVWVLLGTLLSLATFAGIAFAGVSAGMSDSFTAAPKAALRGGLPPAAAVPEGRITVAVAVSNEGSVAADVLAPFEVFASSDRFFVYTVAEKRRPSPLSGGASLLPDHTLEETGTAALPEPDVVVVPAVIDPSGEKEEPLRDWITERAGRGARVLGVCAGSELVAATGLLDGRDATSFWSNIGSLERDYPKVHWKRGERYVEDGEITTTAGITSGTVGALRVVEELAGTAEAERIGQGLAYPGWSLDGPTRIAENRQAPADLPYALGAAFPWLRPTLGIGLVDGVGEIDAAAAFEVYEGVSFAFRSVPLAAGGRVTTRHGVVLLAQPAGDGAGSYGVDRLVVPGVTRASQVNEPLRGWASRHGLEVEMPGGGRAGGEFGFDPVLRDLAAHTDRATALMTAKFSEYPSGHLKLSGPAWPWRTTSLAATTLVLSAGVGLAPTAIRRLVRRRRALRTGTGAETADRANVA
ncbi:DJ-1/PfpI family protein [Streptomyces sp. NPDC094034]|uniref:DJ-1/PfpI family protein n=1 Tax=Streptomyces sp. NPDC094034 TaxID=3155309 RepID=UPI0033185A12